MAVVCTRGGFQRSGVDGIVLSLEALTLRSSEKVVILFLSVSLFIVSDDSLWEAKEHTFVTACSDIQFSTKYKYS